MARIKKKDISTIQMKPLTSKGYKSLIQTGYLNVWEGAVRSAKTVASSIAWGMYVCASSENVFIMSGRTQASLYRNVIGGDFGIINLFGKKNVEYKVTSEGSRVLVFHTKNGDKICYCFGADNSASYGALRGLTAGGWYADEINMHHKDFVEEAFRRTIVSTDRKNFWTLNPDNPYHWIYTEFIDVYTEKKLAGFNLWHFTLDDNLAISDERKEELKLQYSGVFYRRYILGERCLAEGVIYDMWDSDVHVINTGKNPHIWEKLYVSCDYGTHNPCTFGLYGVTGERVHLIDKYYYSSVKTGRQKSDVEYAQDMVDFLGPLKNHVESIIVDPSASSFITELRKPKYKLPQVITAKNDVTDGIRVVQSFLKQRLLTLEEGECLEYEQEFSTYSWDGKAAIKGDEVPIKENDHCMDALRYLVFTLFGRHYEVKYDESVYRKGIENPIKAVYKRSRGVF